MTAEAPKNSLRRLCVFCGANTGVRPEYADSARAMARAMVDHGVDLVYGGGNIGLMGILADAVLDGGGRVTGIIPYGLKQREVAHSGLTELVVVAGMHERKQRMSELADAFISLPGGVGTFEELLEILTWAQLGMHRKPCGLLNVAGYYGGLVGFLEHAVQEGFMQTKTFDLLHVSDSPEALLKKFLDHRPTEFEEWAERKGSG